MGRGVTGSARTARSTASTTLLLPAGVVIPIGQLIVTLVGVVLAPLAVGVGLRTCKGRGVERWSAPLAILSNLLVLLIVVLDLVRYWHDVADAVTNGVAAVAAITVVLALVAGWTVVRSRSGLRIVVAMVTAIRANGLALAIAQASFPLRPAVHAAVVTFAVFSVVVPVAAAFLLAGWRRARPSGAAAVL